MTERNSPFTIVEVVRSARYGGVENHVHALLEHLVRRKCRAVLVSLTNEPVNPKFEQLGIEITQMSDRDESSLRSFLSIIPLARALRKIRPDIVHLHGIRPIFVGSLAARLAGVPVTVSTLYGQHREMAMDAFGTINPWVLAVSKIMHLVGFVLSTRITTISNFGRSDVRGLFRLLPFHRESSLLRKMQTIYCGIAVDYFMHTGARNIVREKMGIAQDCFVFGTVSRLDEPKKGIAVFLKAARILISKGYQVRFLVTGTGFAREQLMKLSDELDLRDHVTFLGYWEDLREVFGTLDAFVLPSLTEGFGLVNLEAMAASLPIVATIAGGIPEAVIQSHNGILVPTDDEGQLASAMAFLFDHPEIAKEMGAKGLERVKSHFQVEDTNAQIYAMYEALRMAPASAA